MQANEPVVDDLRPNSISPDPATERSVSAVVINHNGGDRVLKTVAALVRQTLPFKSIVVVDNGSTDGSSRQVAEQFPAVAILELGVNGGLPSARNIGLRHVNTDFVLLLDNDLYAEPDCLSLLLQATAGHGDAIVCPRVRLLPQRDIVQADGAAAHFVGTMVLRHGYRPVNELSTTRSEVDGCIGACMLLPRSLVLEAGGFDELYFFYFEDLEFSLRMRALGSQFVCEPSAVVYHDRREGTPGLSFRGAGQYPNRRAYLTMRHRILTILIHYRLRTLVVLAPALACYEAACLTLALTRGWTWQWARAWGWNLYSFPIIRRRRERVQSRRLLNDRDLLSGGPIPLAQGVANSRLQSWLVAGLSKALNAYWNVARRFIG